jgi:hypothetical protein
VVIAATHDARLVAVADQHLELGVSADVDEKARSIKVLDAVGTGVVS